jgi:two-component system sensor histidine kinase BarA
VAHSSARNLLGIINDILDFSKIEAEKLALEAAPFSLRTVLDEVAESFRAKVVEKHVELVMRVRPGVPDGVVGDALRFRQVLTNLVGNAFKFTERGEVVVTVAPEEAGIAGALAAERVSVRDTGIGISPEQQARLFTAFSQADTSPRKIRRHGPRLCDQPSPCRDDGRRPDGGKRGSQGSTFHFTARLGVTNGLLRRRSAGRQRDAGPARPRRRG